MKLITVFFALVLACSGAFAQQKVAWETQRVVFVTDIEGKVSLNDEKQFRIENEKQFLAGEIVTEESVKGENPTEFLFKMVSNKEGYELVSKGDAFKTEQGMKGHYVVASFEKQQTAFAVVFMADSKFPLLLSFSINNEDEVKKILHNIYKM